MAKQLQLNIIMSKKWMSSTTAQVKFEDVASNLKFLNHTLARS